MQIPLQITYRDMPHSDALDGRIREKLVGILTPETYDAFLARVRAVK